mmetsp:Transcript_14254/g.45799  ORF Transcript_14254/g.45799 Transcript_14254/m.45799 type:complete len:309 (-) Transcript_14254:125-1051(-)
MWMAVQCVTTSTSTADDSCASADTSSSSASASDIGSLVNLEAFPIEDVSRPFLAAARTALFETGVASFPDFLRPAAVAAAAGEATLASPTAFVTDNEHNAWQTERNTSLPADHLANLFMRTRVASVATDEIGPTLKRLYEAPELLAFLSALLQRPLFRLDDPIGACTINVFREGWHHAWHFDEAEFTVTLSLQAADEGGHFVFTPPLRTSADDPANAAVASVLRAQTEHAFSLPGDGTGESGGAAVPVRTAPFAPGTLQVFAGRDSFHAVTPTRGPRERLVAVLCFASRPGVRNSPAVQQMFWGRTSS